MTAAVAAPARPAAGGRRLTVMGVGFDAITEAELAARVVASTLAGAGGYVVTPNTDIVRMASTNPELRRHLAGADISVADGMPIVWASRILGAALPERVAGSSALWSIAAASAAAACPVYLLGGRPGAAQEAARRLRAAHPGLIVGHHCPAPGFEHDELALAGIGRRIEQFGPAVYFCGLGCPKQEALVADLAGRHRSSWFVGCGGSIDFAAGQTRRAPGALQGAGLEWCWRLAHEPRRLYRRYLVEDLPFAARMLAAAFRAGRRAGRQPAGAVT